MGIRKYSPYTPSRRNMTSLDFAEITNPHQRNPSLLPLRRTPDVTIRVKLQLDIAEAEAEENTESSTSREEKMISLQL